MYLSLVERNGPRLVLNHVSFSVGVHPGPSLYSKGTDLCWYEPRSSSRRYQYRPLPLASGKVRMCSGSEMGSYLRRIDFVYHSTLGLRVIEKKKMDLGQKRCSRNLPRRNLRDPRPAPPRKARQRSLQPRSWSHLNPTSENGLFGPTVRVRRRGWPRPRTCCRTCCTGTDPLEQSKGLWTNDSHLTTRLPHHPSEIASHLPRCTTLEVTQGQILSQSPTDATSSR